jgi:AcrR family transcriptional regulator
VTTTDEDPPHRTRQAQAEASRRRLLDAVFECLLEDGFGGTTVTAITRRAGLSNGALFNHFSNKEELMRAMAIDLGRRLWEQSRDTIAALRHPVDTSTVVDIVWDAMRDDRTKVLMELYVASRTNPELRATFRELDPMFRSAARAITLAAYPELEEHDGLADYSMLSLVIMHGAALHDHALGTQPHIERLKPLVATAFDTLRPDTPTRSAP